ELVVAEGPVERCAETTPVVAGARGQTVGFERVLSRALAMAFRDADLRVEGEPRGDVPCQIAGHVTGGHRRAGATNLVINAQQALSGWIGRGEGGIRQQAVLDVVIADARVCAQRPNAPE